MGKLRALGRILASWYIAGPVLAIVGLAIGYAVFFNVFPGKPKIGVIDIPYTGLSEDSAAIITAYLQYCHRDPDIKAVVIKLSSPGGGASPSEQLYIETRRLREEKPVVLVMNGIVASGGYMMAMGASHTYVKTSSLIGNIGVVAGSGSILAPRFSETVTYTGPYKLTGISRRGWIATMDRLKGAFIEMVVRERGDKLKITGEELSDGRLYSGMEAVALGLADEIGSDTQAYEKAAELAGISNYELVNVNIEVNRLFVQDLRRIYSASSDGETPLTESDTRLMNIFVNRQSPERQFPDAPLNGFAADPEIGGSTSTAVDGGPVNLDALRRPLEHGAMGVPPQEAFPDFPVEINQPQFYYLYVGVAP
jgi:protease-4